MKKRNARAYKHTGLFEANELGGYAVTVPSLPGVVTEGKDLEHARAMAKDAIQCYVRGLKKAKELIPVKQEAAQLEISVIP
jgi:antitoxin HicB